MGLRSVERRFHLGTLVEETAPTNRHSPSVDEVGRFDPGNVSLGHADPGTVSLVRWLA
jgi:hypothetical protein